MYTPYLRAMHLVCIKLNYLYTRIYLVLVPGTAVWNRCSRAGYRSLSFLAGSLRVPAHQGAWVHARVALLARRPLYLRGKLAVLLVADERDHAAKVCHRLRVARCC